MTEFALCFSDSSGLYYRYAATTMLSVFENTSSPAHCHIVHDETLSEDKKAELAEIAEHYGQKLSFYVAPEIDPELVKVVPPQFGIGALYCLFLHELIDADKLIYLDCDIICELDIQELYAIDLGNHPIGAVKEDNKIIVELDERIASIGVNPDNYFNAGVLLLNLRWLQEHGSELLSLMTQRLSSDQPVKSADQDTWNQYFSSPSRPVLHLNEKFNYMVGFNGRHMDDFSVYANKILHLTGEKPWKAFSNSSMLYWKYYSKTIWCSNVIEEILKTKNDKNITLYRFLFENEHTNFAWLRRYYDWKKLGLFGTLKKRLFKKSAQKTVKA